VDDPYYDGHYNEELSSAGSWVTFGLLPFLSARAAEIVKQLDAIDAGTFERTPETIPDDELCQDWRVDEEETCTMHAGPAPSGTRFLGARREAVRLERIRSRQSTPLPRRASRNSMLERDR